MIRPPLPVRSPLAAVAAAALVSSAACSDGRAFEAPPRRPAPPGEVRLPEVPDFVKLARVEPSPEAGATAVTGKVAFDEGRVSRVGAPVSGRVTELLVQAGDRVKKGQGLLVIASPDAESAVADFVAASADAEVTRKTLAREQRLYADQAVPYKEVLQAQSDETKAAAALARAQGRLEVLGIDPRAATPRASRYVLRAPIDGVVVERPANPGMEVRADGGTSLVTVADLSRLWVLADVYERDLGQVAEGQAASVKVAGFPGKVFEGRVGHVGDLVDPATRTVKVRIEVANPDRLLKPEMFARVSLRGAPGEAVLTVPAQAVLSDGEASAVVVALGEGRFQKRTIESGPEQDGRVRVLAGLAPGDQVVVDGALFLRAAIDGT
ncbi:efflux RND transporter periplasmic adaptor subunit [Anaeromyxobacter oryzae]|uniref:RND transporter n=1 Tax=Anaeromyxobacter oryzae TaxID=2918170 RepID=A0ABM7WYS6_9BACT|nr:efflux RND transporter periplasmic adaptor subunit [Anaeromyxobacter oryzae]BDG04682.1 RND transporter [Anaeromyxobacter oryzae]